MTLLGLFVSTAQAVNRWGWNNVPLLLLTGSLYAVAMESIASFAELEHKHDALFQRVTKVENALRQANTRLETEDFV